MNYGAIKKTDIANGVGVRVTLFVSGCTHHCKGCFQPETWDFNYGNSFTTETENEILAALDHDHITGLTLLGGEPFEPENEPTIVLLLMRVKEKFPNKTIWAYSGYTYEELKDSLILPFIDVLVDGPFMEDLKDISLRFKGSSNQRIIDVRASEKAKEVVLWHDENE